MRKLILLVIIVVTLGACKKDKEEVVVELNADKRYTFKVVAKGYWTAQTHPKSFPATAKFGKIVGISHQGENVLFRTGSKAPSWMKSYFEKQSTTAFGSYFKDYKDGDKVDAIFAKDNGFEATGETSFEFQTVGTHNHISLLMQLSPSPDWFAGIHNVNLDGLALGGRATYVVKVWDAGLFSGKTYAEQGSATNENIAIKTDAPLNYTNGGMNNFAIVTVQLKKSEKIKKD